jgi:hypothetical protein
MFSLDRLSQRQITHLRWKFFAVPNTHRVTWLSDPIPEHPNVNKEGKRKEKDKRVVSTVI